MYFCLKLPSASSWGCELKYPRVNGNRRTAEGQPLREAVSWNFLNYADNLLPPVSLFVRLWVEISAGQSCLWSRQYRQPLREAVSWNDAGLISLIGAMPSASSWGCELKYIQAKRLFQNVASASSWGCELKWNHTHTPYISNSVSLFVRLWVEMLLQSHVQRSMPCQPLREAVSWNTAQSGT